MPNHHCSVVRIKDHGILIQGKSGSGKTSLALSLLAQAKTDAVEANFVTDDQALLSSSGGKLIAAAPQLIAGKVEIFGFGITNTPFIEQTSVDLVVDLIPEQEIQRMPSKQTIRLLDMEVPLLHVPIKQEIYAVRIINAWLNQNRL